MLLQSISHICLWVLGDRQYLFSISLTILKPFGFRQSPSPVSFRVPKCSYTIGIVKSSTKWEGGSWPIFRLVEADAPGVRTCTMSLDQKGKQAMLVLTDLVIPRKKIELWDVSTTFSFLFETEELKFLED